MRVEIFTPENRLGKILVEDDGVTFDNLVGNAEERVLTLTESIRAFVAGRIEEITAILREGEASMFGRCDEISHAAIQIAEVAGAAGLPAVTEAARGIRAMADNLHEGGVWHTEALTVHITTLVLLNARHQPTPDVIDCVLKRLRVMRAAIGVVE